MFMPAVLPIGSSRVNAELSLENDRWHVKKGDFAIFSNAMVERNYIAAQPVETTLQISGGQPISYRQEKDKKKLQTRNVIRIILSNMFYSNDLKIWQAGEWLVLLWDPVV